MGEIDLAVLKRLVRELDSDDAFTRRDAIERLAILTQQRLDYRWSAESDERRRAIKRWQRWLAREERERRGRSVQTTIQILAGAPIDKAALEEALKGLPPAQKKALMAQVLAKVTGQAAAALPHLPVCEQCGLRPATAQVTALEPDGTYSQRRLCEPCVHG